MTQHKFLLDEAYHQGKLEDFEYPTALVEEAMKHLPRVHAGVT